MARQCLVACGCLAAPHLVGCQPACDVEDAESLVHEIADDEVRDALSEVWTTFEQAIRPDRVCVPSIRVDDLQSWLVGPHEGRYNRLTGAISIDETAYDPADTLRHELCHAWHEQVHGGAPPSETFFLTYEDRWEAYQPSLGSRSARFQARESLAFLCEPGFDVTQPFGDAACGTTPPQAALAWMQQELLHGAPVPAEDVTLLLDIPIPDDSVAPREIRTASEVVEGHVSILLEASTSTDLWLVDLEQQQIRFTTGHLRDLPRLDSPEPSRPERWVFEAVDSGAHDGTSGAVFQFASPLGPIARSFVRRGAESPWRLARGACHVSDAVPGNTSFFVGGAGTALWSVSIHAGRLVVLDWS